MLRNILFVLIIFISGCTSSGISVGVGTGFGGRHGGVNIGLGGTVPIGTDSGGIFSSDNTPQVPDNVMRQEAKNALDRINQLRRSRGLHVLNNNPSLQAFAMTRAQELAQNYSHRRPDGRMAIEQIRSGAAAVELIARTESLSSEQATDYWQNKSRRLSENIFTAAGIGVYAVGGEAYWVLILGNENSFAVY